MSHAKKNKGRTKEAINNDPLELRLVQKFQDMVETDYMRNIVMPVLQKEGYESIDYHHGTNEVGKDLIFSRTGTFGSKKLVVAVVKSEKLSKKASSNNGFPNVLVQLQQAKKNEVMGWDGAKRYPDELLLIFADDPSHEVISSNPGLFQDSVRDGLQIIFGTQIAKSLLKNRPDIADQILQTKLDTAGYLLSNPTNAPLLGALGSSEALDVQTIFTDLDAAVGATTMAHAVSLRSSDRNEFAIEKAAWPGAKEAIRTLEQCIGKILKDPVEDVEKRFNETNKKAQSQANVQIYKTIERTTKETQQRCTTISQEFRSRLSALIDIKLKGPTKNSTEFDHSISVIDDTGKKILSDLEELRNCSDKVINNQYILGEVCTVLTTTQQVLTKFISHRKILERLWVERTPNEHETKLHDLTSGLIDLLVLEIQNLESIMSDWQRCKTLAKKYVPPTDYRLHIDNKTLDDNLDLYIRSILNRFQSEMVAKSKDYAKQLLIDARQFLSAMQKICSNPTFSTLLQPKKPREPIGACILGLLNSGIDVLVTGHAGSGKSTTLDMFARRRVEQKEEYEEVIFLPLAKVLIPDDWRNSGNKQSDAAIHYFCEEVAKLYKNPQSGVTSQLVKEQICKAKKLILILDGVDEALLLIPWLINLIHTLREKISEVQVVASSRFPIPELVDKDLLTIELLPFNPEQVKRFVMNYLENEPHLAEQVINHLEQNPKMFSVSQTPLMSTILCVLAKSGVVLPSTKTALYKERFELLWGTYDANKQVRRVSSRKECLEDVSKKSAFYLHNNRLRSAPRSNILLYVTDTLKRKYSVSVINKAVEELERPCNVLIEDLDGIIGFGHLSYQEYLASDELYTNRHSEILRYLDDPWWREVLVLTAMKTEDIGEILAQRIASEGRLGRAKDTLKAMIEVCDVTQKRDLTKLLRDHEKLDQFDRATVPFEFDDEYDALDFPSSNRDIWG